MALDTTVALISVADAQSYIGITGEVALLENLIHEASRFLVSFCGRTFVSTTFTEYYDGSGEAELILRVRPVISVTSVHEDSLRAFGSSVLIDSGDYMVLKEQGIIRLWNTRAAFIRGAAVVKVVYVAGWATIPYDIQQAVKELVALKYFKQNKRRHGVDSETIGETTTGFNTSDLPKDIKSVLENYRDMAFVPHFSYS